jgi:hypothetical protein
MPFVLLILLLLLDLQSGRCGYQPMSSQLRTAHQPDPAPRVRTYDNSDGDHDKETL